MTDKEFKNWMETRIKGQTRFILMHGLLIYGLYLIFCFLGLKFLFYLIKNNFDLSFFNTDFIGESFILLLFFWFYGIILAWKVWHRKEKEFLQKESEINV